MPSRPLACILLGLLLVGCSNASDHAKLVTAFADTSEKAQKALIAFDQVAAERLTERIRQAAIKSPVGVRAEDKTCLTSAGECRVLFSRTRDDKDPQPLSYSTVIPNHLAAMQVIVLYGKALKEVVEVDTTAEVKAAVDKASGAVINLAQVANIAAPGAGAAAAAFVPVIGQSVLWAVGRYQESLKIAALKHATDEMEKVLPDAARFFANEAVFAHRARIAEVAKEFNAADEAFQTARNEAALNKLLAAANEFDAVLKAKPGDVFTGIAKVHKDLNTALNKPTATLANAFANIDRLAAEAEKLVKIAESFRKAAASLEAKTP